MDESYADDGAVHRFYRYTADRGYTLEQLADLVTLLVAILRFELERDTVPDVG